MTGILCVWYERLDVGISNHAIEQKEVVILIFLFDSALLVRILLLYHQMVMCFSGVTVQIIESYIFIDTHYSRQLAWNNCCSIIFQGRLSNKMSSPAKISQHMSLTITSFSNRSRIFHRFIRLSFRITSGAGLLFVRFIRGTCTRQAMVTILMIHQPVALITLPRLARGIKLLS